MTSPVRSALPFVASTLLALALAADAEAQTLFVDLGATGAADGSSWADAFPDVDAALAVATPGAQVWIAQGKYFPSLPTDPGDPRSATYLLVDGVALYGGFVGFESSLAQRGDPAAHPTRLSGDIGTTGVSADNTYHVVTADGVGPGTLLDGLFIQEGRANGTGVNGAGAGVQLNAASPVLRGCTIQFNSGISSGSGVRNDGGGAPLLEGCLITQNTHGLYSDAGSLTLRGCTISGCFQGHALYQGNTALTMEDCVVTGNSGGVGVVRLGSNSTATIRRCTFSANTAGALSTFAAVALLVEDCLFEGNSGNNFGSAVSMFQNIGVPSFVRCTFRDNVTDSNGGAVGMQTTKAAFTECAFEGNVAAQLGGAVHIAFEAVGSVSGSPFTSCSFVGNTAASGGALTATGGQGGFNVFGSNPVLTGCLFSGNVATERGGALWVNSNSEPRLVQCTLSGNHADLEGGALYAVAAGSIPGPGIPDVTLHNSIAWGNSDASGSGQASQLFMQHGSLRVEHCAVQGWDGSLGGAGNHGLDPLFLDADGPDDVLGTADDDLRLPSGSPCVDAGSDALVPADGADLDCDGDTAEALALDHARVGRVDDDPHTADTGVGPAPMVDMGAYERSAWTHLGQALAGVHGEPCLVGLGTLVGGTIADHRLTNARESATAGLFLGLSEVYAPFKKGVLVPSPDLLFILVTSPTGTSSAPGPWPVGIPSGASFAMQYWIQDPAALVGVSASNAIRGVTP